MPDIKQAQFSDWAIVEVMGHQRFAGFVTTEAFGQATLFRIDVPAQPARERITKRGGYIGDGSQWIDAGATVQEEATPGYTKLIGAGSIYAITPCTEEAAREAVDEIQPRKLKLVQLPPKALIPEGGPLDEEDNLPDELGQDSVRGAS